MHRTSRKLLVWLSVWATVLAAAPAAFAQTLHWGDERQIELPFTLDRGRVVVEGRVNGAPARILVDSGAARPAVGKGFLAALDQDLRRTRARTNGVWMASVRGATFALGPLTIDTRDSVIMQAPGEFDAIIGRDVTEQAVLDIDFDRRLLTILHPEAFTPPEGANFVALGRANGGRTIDIRLNDGRPVCARIDTGFTNGLTLTPRAVADNDLIATPGASTTLTGIDGVPRPTSLLAPVSRLAFAGHTFTDVTAMKELDNGRCSSLIGMPLLLGYRLIFDLPNDRLWLVPRPGIGNTFLRYAGLTLREIEGGLLVVHAAGGWPIQPGDIIQTINGRSEAPQIRPSVGDEIDIVMAGGAKFKATVKVAPPAPS